MEIEERKRSWSGSTQRRQTSTFEEGKFERRVGNVPADNLVVAIVRILTHAEGRKERNLSKAVFRRPVHDRLSHKQ